MISIINLILNEDDSVSTERITRERAIQNKQLNLFNAFDAHFSRFVSMSVELLSSFSTSIVTLSFRFAMKFRSDAFDAECEKTSDDKK